MTLKFLQAPPCLKNTRTSSEELSRTCSTHEAAVCTGNREPVCKAYVLVTVSRVQNIADCRASGGKLMVNGWAEYGRTE